MGIMACISLSYCGVKWDNICNAWHTLITRCLEAINNKRSNIKVMVDNMNVLKSTPWVLFMIKHIFQEISKYFLPHWSPRKHYFA